jgi:hypothetical protein
MAGIQPELQLVRADNTGDVVGHVELLLQVVTQLAGDEFKSRGIKVAEKKKGAIGRF